MHPPSAETQLGVAYCSLSLSVATWAPCKVVLTQCWDADLEELPAMWQPWDGSTHTTQTTHKLSSPPTGFQFHSGPNSRVIFSQLPLCLSHVARPVHRLHVHQCFLTVMYVCVWLCVFRVWKLNGNTVTAPLFFLFTIPSNLEQSARHVISFSPALCFSYIFHTGSCRGDGNAILKHTSSLKSNFKCFNHINTQSCD